MRLERLRFAALGPYAGEHLIDFEMLGGSGLFIIEGPTGAGKSTILDAIVFALYSDVAGEGSDKQRLRSGFADPVAESFAEVEFSSSSGRYRVRRTPEFTRPRKRGEGADVDVASTIQVWRSTGEHGWELVSGRHREAEIEIVRAVGLDKGQFLQTVVLPQGEFARFLRAKSAERQAILEQVFATSVFAKLQEWSDEQRKVAEAGMATLAGGVRDSIQQLVGAIFDPMFGRERGVLGDPGSTRADVDEAIDRASATAAERMEATAAAALVLRVELEARERLVDRVREWRAAARARADAGQVVEAATKRVEAARDVAGGHVHKLASLTSKEIDLADPDDAVSKADEAIGSLREVMRQAEVRPGLVLDLERLEREAVKAETTSARLTAERESDLPGLLAWCKDELECRSRELEHDYSTATGERDSLVQARMDGMAGELAEGLTAGEPCPVCGSKDHPIPAAASEFAVTPGDIAAAGQRVESVSAKRLAIAPDLTAARALTGQIDEAAAVPVAVDDDPAAVLAEVIGRLELIAEELPLLAERCASSRAQAAQRAAAITAIDLQLAAASGGFATIDERMADVARMRADVVALGEAIKVRASAVRTEAEAQSMLEALEEPVLDEPDVASGSLEEQLVEARTAMTDATSGANAARRLHDDLEAKKAAVDSARALHDQAVQASAATISLANTLNGRGANQLLQPLKAYVLQQMFDEVIEAANARLSGMLEGRFALVDTEQAQGRERILGLGLAISDRFTDSVRRADTLSGGETFCAALALALGLADTVRAHAGGIDIGMLFVDEGFGSLDPDRLDDVMAELTRLRADGRTVGVISHVSEMKRSILERISVRPLDPGSGSTLSVTWMGE
jgi:exonuclease SbcC